LMLEKDAPVLVVAAHHDDEVLGCGATIARLVREGHPVTITILGQGAVSRCPGMGQTQRKAMHEAIINQAEAAAKILDASFIQAGEYPDNAFDSVTLLEIVRSVEAVVKRVRPQLILTHHHGDMNIDHRLTSAAVQTAARPLPGATVRTILAFEVPSSTEWSMGVSVFQPNLYVDATPWLDGKIKAMRCYENELRPFPHPRSEEGIRLLAGYRGVTAGLKSAEAFALVRSVTRDLNDIGGMP